MCIEPNQLQSDNAVEQKIGPLNFYRNALSHNSIEISSASWIIYLLPPNANLIT